MATDWANHPILLKLNRGEALTEAERNMLGGSTKVVNLGHVDRAGGSDDRYFSDPGQAKSTQASSIYRPTDKELWDTYVAHQQDVESGGGGIGDLLSSGIDSASDFLSDASDSIGEEAGNLEDSTSEFLGDTYKDASDALGDFYEGASELVSEVDDGLNGPDLEDTQTGGTINVQLPGRATEDRGNRRNTAKSGKGIAANIFAGRTNIGPRVTTKVLTGH